MESAKRSSLKPPIFSGSSYDALEKTPETAKKDAHIYTRSRDVFPPRVNDSFGRRSDRQARMQKVYGVEYSYYKRFIRASSDIGTFSDGDQLRGLR
jgi:hypothetical protein